VIGSYEYESLLRKTRSALIVGTGMAGLEFFVTLLSGSLAMRETESGEELVDYSWSWRPAIEDNPQNSFPSTKSLIVSAVRDSALELARHSPESLDQVVGLLEAQRWPVMKRIALEVLRQVAPSRSAAVSLRLLSTDWMFDIQLHHEYWSLLRDRFPRLGPKQRQALLDIIKVGPPIYRDPDGPFADDSVVALECWQVRLLAAIADYLDADDRAWLADLVSKGRLSEHPDLLSWTTGVMTGPNSPLDAAELQALSDDEILEYLRGWRPSSGFMAPSPEGLGRAIGAAVKDDPGRFAALAEQMFDVDPTYVNALLSAFRELASTKQAFSWGPILRLAGWVVRQPREVPERVSEYGDRDYGWTWTRSTIGHLLYAGLNSYEGSLELDDRSLVWSILEPLTHDPNPSPAEEEEFGGSNMDPTMLAINSVRGQAVHAVVKYALWVYGDFEARDEAATFSFDSIPEVRSVLIARLSDDEPSLAVRSVFGQWLPWLHLMDPQWTSHQLNAILPPDSEDALYWEASWDSYISHCPPFNDMFELLRLEYARAIARLNDPTGDRRRPMMAVEQLVQHLATFYMRGLIQINDPLLTDFFNTAPEELRASALRFVGRNLYLIEQGAVKSLPDGVAPEIVERAEALWSERLDAARGSREGGHEFAKEMEQFGWWFVAPVVDELWALDQLAAALELTGHVDSSHLVVPRLVDLMPGHSTEVLRCLKLMVRGEPEGWGVSSWSDSIAEILRIGLRSTDRTIRDESVSLTHELGARGFREFRDLLRDNGDSRTS
jgi:hypothetical protein